MPNAKLAFSIGLVGCATAIAMPSDIAAPASAKSEPSFDPDIVAFRAGGPAALDALLLRYDRIHDGAARDALALRIDKVAAQRYATVSRLYWYTDLAQAEAAAAKAHKPILALRMLGRLDEDLSCANSRMFRATLYANKDVSQYMKSNFILYWSSERDVPRVTIDFGDGRKIESTTTGNSAHYILDEKGEVLDVLPGLYAPHAFRAELASSLAHARDVAAAPAHERGARIIQYHHDRIAQMQTRTSKLQVHAMRDGRYVTAELAAELAQEATMAKAYIEVPQLRQITSLELKSLRDDEMMTWSLLGGQLWKSVDSVFDQQSLGLITRLHTQTIGADRNALAQMKARLAQLVLADSALNEMRLRPEIHAFLAKGSTDFATINNFIYANVFHTPKSDPWLGLLPRTNFTGLPGDGVTIPSADTTTAKR